MKFIEQNLCSCTHFFIVTLCFYLYGERNVKPFQAVYVSIRTIFVLSTCDGRTLARTETLYFLAVALLFTWMVKEYKAVSSSVSVSKPRFYVKQPRFYVKQTPFLCETTLSPCGRSRIFVDGSVSLGQLPFLFRLDRIVSVWTALFQRKEIFLVFFCNANLSRVIGPRLSLSLSNTVHSLFF